MRGRLRTHRKQFLVTLCAAAVMAVACQATHGPSSSLSACSPQQPCTKAAEQCFSTAACGPPPGGCQTPETGDLKCHLTCVDDASCAENERCVAQSIFEPPQVQTCRRPLISACLAEQSLVCTVAEGVDARGFETPDEPPGPSANGPKAASGPRMTQVASHLAEGRRGPASGRLRHHRSVVTVQVKADSEPSPVTSPAACSPHGFERLACLTCRAEVLVPFPYKSRGVCPS